MSCEYSNDQTLQHELLNGADILANNVASTLGPRGRNVILQQKGQEPIITKDGVTVAKFVNLDNPFQNAAAQIMKQAASQTNIEAGDGTTTSIVLTRAILTEAQKFIAAGASPVELKRGIDKAVTIVLRRLTAMAEPIRSEEEITYIATVSANGDEAVGKLIAKAVDLTGKDGAVSIKEARSVETSLDIVEGFRFNSGYLASAFITDERIGNVRYDNPLFLVTDAKIESVDELMPVLEIVAREGRPFVIVAENVEGQALAALIMNATRGTLKVAAIKAPRYGEERRNILKDLALSVGATFITHETGLKLQEATLKHLGSAKSIEATKNFTTIVDGKGDHEEVEGTIESLKAVLAQTESLHECEKIQERITRLASGIAIINVGAPTEVEMIEKKHRIEDALSAVNSAQQQGIVPGGGTALLRAIKNIKVKVDNQEQAMGVEIVKKAVEAPLKQMAMNAGESPDIIIERVKKSQKNKGWNFSKGKLANLYDDGIIDPVKVTRCALRNAASAASTLITTNYCIIEK